LVRAIIDEEYQVAAILFGNWQAFGYRIQLVGKSEARAEQHVVQDG
jgi:hypothetical protein